MTYYLKFHQLTEYQQARIYCQRESTCDGDKLEDFEVEHGFFEPDPDNDTVWLIEPRAQ